MKQIPAPQLSPWYSHARVAVTALEAAGIPAALADVHIHHAYPSLEFGVCRTRILIPPACQAEAIEIMERARASVYPPLYPCPVCAGETRQRKRILAMIIMILLGCFIPLKSDKRRCGACQINLDAPAITPFTVEELGEEPIADAGPGADWMRRLVAGVRALFRRRRYWDTE